MMFFEVLKDCDFRISQKILNEKIITNEIEVKENGEKPIFKEIEVGRVLVWNLYEIN